MTETVNVAAAGSIVVFEIAVSTGAEVGIVGAALACDAILASVNSNVMLSPGQCSDCTFAGKTTGCGFVFCFTLFCNRDVSSCPSLFVAQEPL